MKATHELITCTCVSLALALVACGGGGGGSPTGSGPGSGSGAGGAGSSSSSSSAGGSHSSSSSGSGGGAAGTTSSSSSATSSSSSGAPDVLRVFTTQTTFDGNLGGLSGADAKCMTAAQVAGLGGSWTAWLSDGTTNAIDRITADGPWYLMDGTTKAFASKAALTQSPLTALDVDENGQTIQEQNPFMSEHAWTGTRQGGMTQPGNFYQPCIEASGPFGTADGASSAVAGLISTPPQWTDDGFNGGWSCNSLFHLYCFQQK